MKIAIPINRNPDHYLSLYCCGYLLLLSVNVSLSSIGGLSSLWSPIYMILQGGLTLFGLYGLIKKKRFFFFVLVELIILLLFGLTYIRHTFTNMSVFVDSIRITCVTSIPFSCCLHEIDDRKKLLDSMYKTSLITHVFIYFSMLFYTNSGYSMSLGYSLLPHLLILIDRFFENRRAYNIIIAAIDIIYTVLFCSRGPLVSIGLYVVIRLILSKDVSKKAKVLTSLTVVASVVVIIVFWTEIIGVIENLATTLGVSSRTVNLIKSSQFITHDSGRSTILASIAEQIQLKPVTGWGIGGGWAPTYPHNVIYESILSFGYILGTAFIVYIIYKWIKVLRTDDDSYQRLGFLFGANVLTLLFSSSMVRGYVLLAFILL
jgi:hypothetical protein